MKAPEQPGPLSLLLRPLQLPMLLLIQLPMLLLLLLLLL
jgi:hypothetical protein